MIKKIVEKEREIEVKGEYDVIVVGGGPAGIAASIAAKRGGAKTILVERYGFLGGMATAGMVGSFCGFFTTGSLKKMIVGGIANKIIELLKHHNAVSEKSISRVDPRIASMRFNPEIFKFVVEDLISKNDIELLFHTLAVEIIWSERSNNLSGIVIENKSGRFALLGKIIIDATGDADIAFKAGVPFEVGDKAGKTQALTTMFRLINVDIEKMKDLTLQEVRRRLESALQTGEYRITRIEGIINPALPIGIVSANITCVSDISALNSWQLTKAEIEGRRQALEYIKVFRHYLPGFENAELSCFAPQIGIRETRRIQGDYILDEQDVIKGRKFEDAICLGAWPIEIHNPEKHLIEWKFLEKEDDYYTIPLRSILPKNVENLIVVGRCISATHEAQASIRVIAQAFGTGEAAGLIASESISSKSSPREVRIDRIKKELIRQGAILEA